MQLAPAKTVEIVGCAVLPGCEIVVQAFWRSVLRLWKAAPSPNGDTGSADCCSLAQAALIAVEGGFAFEQCYGPVFFAWSFLTCVEVLRLEYSILSHEA